MDIAETNALLIETAIASTAAIALVLLLRRPLRARFGATIGYAAWLLVPAALIAVLLPAAATAPAPISMVLRLVHAVPQAAAADPLVTVDRSAALAVAWAVGVVAMVVWFATRQRRFLRAIGPLRRRDDGLQQASASRGLPAALGLWRPRIVVPLDFEQRYSREQQALLTAHERSHIRQGDLWANALLAALRCLLWFNPLLHLAARHFRHDQELACDQRVIARHPHSRYAYGEAMFKTQLATQALPLGCHWGYGHPLKERIEMLKQPVPGMSRWVAGSAAVAVLTLVVGFTAWAAQPAPVPAVVGTAMPPVPPPPAAPLPPPAPSPAPTLAAPPPPPPVPPAPAHPAPPPPPPPPSLPPSLPPPSYPAAAVAQKVSGVVVLVIDIDAQGKPVDIVVERSEPAGVFDQAAVDAAWKWQFTPELEGGKPVASRVRVPVDFEIPPGTTGQGTPAGAA